MKPLRSWLARLAFVGAWAIVSGCGSGDIPDPSNDASGQNPGASGPPPVNAPSPAAESPQVASADTKSEEAKPEEAKPEEPAAAPEAANPAPTPAAAPAPAGAPAAAPSEAAAVPDKNSATADLLALSSKDPQAAPAAGSGDAANPQAGGPGGAAGPGAAAGPGPGGPGPGGGPPNMPPGMGPPGGGMSPMNMGPNAPPGAGGGMQAQMAAGGGMQGQMQAQQQGQMQQMQQMQAQMQAQMQRGMGGPGGPGAPGAPGGMMGPGGPGGPGGGSSKAPDFRSPQGAVQAFLDAAKDKDLGKLTDATALRAPAEATNRNKDMFTRILDGTYSKEEIDKLAGFLEGYQLAFLNQAKSTGRQQVVLQKRGDNNSIQRVVITARREKKGWGVCDVSGVQTIKSPRFGPMRSNSSKR